MSPKEVRHVVTDVGDAVRLQSLDEGELFVEPWQVDHNLSNIDYHVRKKIDNFRAETLLGTRIEVYPSLLVCPVKVAGKKPTFVRTDKL